MKTAAPFSEYCTELNTTTVLNELLFMFIPVLNKLLFMFITVLNEICVNCC